jgi:hypothetical protein
MLSHALTKIRFLYLHQQYNISILLGVEPGTARRRDPGSSKRLQILRSSISQRERVDIMLTQHAWECRITQKANLFFTSLL